MVCAVLGAYEAVAGETAHVVLFTPADVAIPTNAQQRLTQIADTTEKFYFKWMNHWGYPPDVTNLFCRETNGLVEVLRIRGDKSVKTHEYHKWSGGFLAEVSKKLGQFHVAGNVHWWWIFVYLGDRPARYNDFKGMGNPAGGGWAMVNYDSLPGDLEAEESPVKGFNGQIYLKGMMHELGHAFGLPHQGPDPTLGFGNSLMGPMTELYAAEKLPQPDELYLCEASAATLWKHPIFSGADVPDFHPFEVNLQDYKAEFLAENNCIVVTGKLVSDRHAHSVVLIDDKGDSRNLYWSESYAARIAPDGTFRLLVKHPAKGTGHFRFLFCFDDGLVTGDGQHVRFAEQRDIRKTYRSDRGRYVFLDEDVPVKTIERFPALQAR